MATAPPGRAALTRPSTRPNRPIQSKAAQLRVIRGGRQTAGNPPANEVVRVSIRPAPGLTFVALATSIVAICVFGVVLLQVMLAQTSFELQKVHEQLVTQETKYRRMRFEVANAEAPAKIHEAAARLGLVVPAEQRYVFGPDSPPPSNNDTTKQAEPANDKAGLKAVLSKQP